MPKKKFCAKEKNILVVPWYFFYITGSPIKHILHDYQPVYYDHNILKQQHERMRRSLINTMDFEFGTHNRYVVVVLFFWC